MILSISRLVEDLRKKLPKRIEIEEFRDKYDSQLSYYKLYNPLKRRTVWLSIKFYKYLSVTLDSSDKWDQKTFNYLLKRDRKLSLTYTIEGFLMGLQGSRSFPRSEALVPPRMYKVYQNLNRVGKRSQTEYFISCSFDDDDARRDITDALDRGPDYTGLVGGMLVWYFDGAEELSMAQDKIEYYESKILKRENTMRKITIKEEVRIPGTNIVLEENDRILYQLKESKLDDVKRKLRSLGFEDQGDDVWDNYEGTEVILGDDSITISSEEDPYGDEVSFSEFLRHPGEYLS